MRGGTGAPTAADSATLRANLQKIVDAMMGPDANAPQPGPTQCHDITVYPDIGLAGGACGGHGLLLDITDVPNPKPIDEAADINMSFWQSATFSNDGDKGMFSDEGGGGQQPAWPETDQVEMATAASRRPGPRAKAGAGSSKTLAPW